MRLHFLSIQVHSSTAAEAELNHFLATHRVLSIDRQFISDGSGSSWALCISYVEGSAAGAASAPNQDSSSKKRLDYRDLLPPAEFLLFVKLRDLRKQLAEREGVPPYAVFTNEQLAEMIRRCARTLSELANIEGIGPARVEKYGRTFLEALQAAPPLSDIPAVQKDAASVSAGS